MKNNNQELPKILVVDDTKANLTAMRILLKGTKAEVVEANSGNEALALALYNDYALILLDIQMPEMDGYEVAEFLRQEQNTQNIPIIFVTAVYRDDEHKLKAYGSGAVDFIEKPITKEILLSKVNIFLDLYLHKKNLESARIKAISNSKELAGLNQNLESIVEQRTQKLQESLDVLKNTQAQMIESEKMASLGSLVAGVAHEINTPIGSSLTGITHLKDITKDLKKKYDKQEVSKSAFEDYLSSSLELNEAIHINLLRTIELIRSFKQVAVDQSSNKSYDFSLKERIDFVLMSLHHLVKTSKVEINIECDEDLIIFSDPGVIVQIITNFITNSFLHAFEEKDEGTILIKAFKKEKIVHLIYEDTGKGISEENIPKIFEPFFTTNRLGGGTGLGMHIIYNIVHAQLGGTISVNSELGKGVQFEIIFESSSDKE